MLYATRLAAAPHVATERRAGPCSGVTNPSPPQRPLGPAAVSGFPSVTVPMGAVDELPIGISFLGKAFGEAELIRIAFAYEQASKNRKAPRFIGTVKA